MHSGSSIPRKRWWNKTVLINRSSILEIRFWTTLEVKSELNTWLDFSHAAIRGKTLSNLECRLILSLLPTNFTEASWFTSQLLTTWLTLVHRWSVVQCVGPSPLSPLKQKKAKWIHPKGQRSGDTPQTPASSSLEDPQKPYAEAVRSLKWDGLLLKLLCTWRQSNHIITRSAGLAKINSTCWLQWKRFGCCTFNSGCT